MRIFLKKSPEQMSDKELILKVQASDTELFGILYERHHKRALAVASAKAKNRDDAECYVHDAFMRAFTAIHTFNVEMPFYPWFFRILHNHVVNSCRSVVNQRTTSLDAIEEDQFLIPKCVGKNPQQRASENQRRERLWRCLERLCPDHREIIVMRHFHDMAYRDISAALGIPLGTVMSRLYFARQELKVLWNEATGDTRFHEEVAGDGELFGEASGLSA